MLYIGTSGFSYDDWKAQWYPPDLPRRKYFDYYAERFDAVEINSTFYHIYSPTMMRSLVERAAGRVRFAVKMSELVTHRGLLDRPIALSYVAGIEPAIRAGVLSAVLLQFPQRFHFTRENREYLEKTMKTFAGLPLVLEIRHDSWQTPPANRFVRESGISLCLLDMPRLRGLPKESRWITGPIGYVRFHGRNGPMWWSGNAAGGRYDYLYSTGELEDWVGTADELSRNGQTALVFFNNHPRAQAAHNAEEFAALAGRPLARTGYVDLISGGP